MLLQHQGPTQRTTVFAQRGSSLRISCARSLYICNAITVSRAQTKHDTIVPFTWAALHPHPDQRELTVAQAWDAERPALQVMLAPFDGFHETPHAVTGT